MFIAGLAPEANYGAEVWGVSDAEAIKLRRTAAKALLPRSRCRSLTALHLVHGMPTCREELRTVIHFAKQVWRAATDRDAASARGMSLPDIRRHWEAAHEGIKEVVNKYRDSRADGGGAVGNKAARRAWDAIRGPVGAAALTLARIGWSFKSPFVLADAFGDEVVLTTTSPAMLTKLLADAARDECERAVGRMWARQDGKFAGRRACIDLAVKAIKCGPQHGLTRVQVGALRAAVCNGVYTHSRAVAEGYDIADECPECGAAGDTPHHRIYCCSATSNWCWRNPSMGLRRGQARQPQGQVLGDWRFPPPGGQLAAPQRGYRSQGVRREHGDWRRGSGRRGGNTSGSGWHWCRWRWLQSSGGGGG